MVPDASAGARSARRHAADVPARVRRARKDVRGRARGAPEETRRALHDGRRRHDRAEGMSGSRRSAGMNDADLAVNWRDIKNPEAGGAEVHLHEILSRLVALGARGDAARAPAGPAARARRRSTAFGSSGAGTGTTRTSFFRSSRAAISGTRRTTSCSRTSTSSRSSCRS